MGGRFSFDEIDSLAEQYRMTGDPRLEGMFITKLDPYLFTVAAACTTRISSPNVCDDWFQELRIESLRLFRRWVPKEKLKFNYFLRNQIGNFCISSYIHATAKKRNQSLEKDVDIATLNCLAKDLLTDLENREIIEKVFNSLNKLDQKILSALWEGYLCSDIEKEFRVSATMISNLKKRVKQIIVTLLTDKVKGELCEKG